MYLGDQLFVSCGVGEGIFPFSQLSFCLIYHVLCLTEAFQFQEVPFNDCCGCATCVIFRKWSPLPMCSRLLTIFSSMGFIMLRSLIHLYFSFVHGDKYGLFTFFSMATSNYVSTIC